MSSTVSRAQLSGEYGKRSLHVWAFILVTAVWVSIVKVVGVACADHAHVHDGRLLTTENLTWALVVPLGAGCLFVYAVIAVLGWWRPLLYDPKPVRRWVWSIPDHLRHRDRGRHQLPGSG
jgi:hypothetical protein